MLGITQQSIDIQKNCGGRSMLRSMLKKKKKSREERPSEGFNGFKWFGHCLMRLPLMLIARIDRLTGTKEA